MPAMLDSSPPPIAGASGPAFVSPRSKRRSPPRPSRALGGFATTMSEMLGPRETHAFGILAYHRIAEPVPGRPAPTWNVPPDRLRQQLQGLCDRGFRAWPLNQVLERLAEGKPIPSKVFVVTFDGAYENVYLNAFPILRQLAMPATVFVSTAYLDSSDPFDSDDWDEAGSGNVPYTAWRPISTDECQELRKGGLVEIGVLAPASIDAAGSPGELAKDLRLAERILRERLAIEKASVALPFRRSLDIDSEGGVDDGLDVSANLTAAAQEAGSRCALLNEQRLVRQGDSPLAWGRFAADEHDTAASLAAKLSGWYEAVHALGDTLLGRGKRQAAPPPSTGAETAAAPEQNTEQ
jgi:hypothetical protein